jgi:DNA-damage-inducible protein D
VIEKAIRASENSENEGGDHFVDINKMVLVGSKSERRIDDIVLSRYACYLIV